MCVLVTTSNVCNPEGIRSVLTRPVVCGDMCDFDLCVCEARDSQSSFS